jgi:hypothetical protein
MKRGEDRMIVTYGADYSAHELTPAELDSFTHYHLRFLIRYIGWPDNPKCISHYPGAYHDLVSSGRIVLLVIEDGTTDPAGGHEGGVAMAHRAAQDADSIGYPHNWPIFFCADGWLALSNIPVATAMSYLDGAASVIGKNRTGAYGFRDFIQAAKAGGHAEWLWLCGTAPADGEVAQGWPHLYQWNGGFIYPGGMQADLNWAYPGVLEAVQAGTPPPAHFPLSPPPAYITADGTSTLAQLATLHHCHPSGMLRATAEASPRGLFPPDVASFVNDAAGPAVPPKGMRLVVPQ